MKSKNLLLIFTRNPELGKVKSRLAATIGPKKALIIYKELLNHTHKTTVNLNASKWLFYSENIAKNDIWDENCFDKKLQQGSDLGSKMKHAFEEGFKSGFEKIIIIGSDIYDLQQKHIEEAFVALENHNSVLGPSLDGGYYLLGMRKLNPEVFENKNWGSDSVQENTLIDLKSSAPFFLLENLNDIDVISDIKPDSYLRKFI
jgi:rSAM/selenodomain-associated transferase 1